MASYKGTMAVALLDVLGFRALMAEMEPEELYKATLGEFDTMIERSTSLPLNGRTTRYVQQPSRPRSFYGFKQAPEAVGRSTALHACRTWC
jgi:hypothetical protein